MVKSFQKRHEMGNIEVARNDVFEICLFEWIDSVVREIYEHRLKELYALKPPPIFTEFRLQITCQYLNLARTKGMRRRCDFS